MERKLLNDDRGWVFVFLFWLGLQVSFILFAGHTISGDVWAYAKSAQVFHETGRLMVPDRSPQSLIFLTLWSGLFTKLFGFSFITLNFASLTLSVIGVVFFVLLLKEVEADGSITFPLTVYLFNPLFFLVAGGYLTDAPFLSLIVIATYFFVRAYRQESVAWALVGSLIAACAFLVRQYAVLLPAAAVVPLFLLNAGPTKSKKLTMTAATVIPTLITAILYFLWLTYRHGTPGEFTVYKLELLNLPRILWSALAIPFFAGIYLGFFLSPLIPGRVLRGSREEKRLWVFYFLVFVGIAILLAVRGRPLPFGWHAVMPYLRNTFNPPAGSGFWIIITAWGIVGAATLFASLTASAVSWLRSQADGWDGARRSRRLVYVRAGVGVSLTAFLLLASGLLRRPLVGLGEWAVTRIYHSFGGASGRHTFTLSHWIDQVPKLYDQTVLALSLILLVVSGTLVYGYLVIKKPRAEAPSPEAVRPSATTDSFRTLLIGFLTVSVAFLIWFYTDKDRYLLVLLPAAILLIHARPENPSVRPVSLLLVILLSAIAIGNALVGAQLSRNMWTGGHYLLNRGISPERIRAGVGFNAWHLYDQRGKRRPNDPADWWVIGDDYVVDTKLWSGYGVIKELPYWNCFKVTQESVYVMERMEPR
jgi:hypothetical protein